MQMVNQRMKICSMSLITEKSKNNNNNNPARYHFTPTRMGKIKNAPQKLGSGEIGILIHGW